MERLDIRHLQVGKGAADLRFSRNADGLLDVEVLNIAGTLTVEVEKK
jgi:hypothetical protein